MCWIVAPGLVAAAGVGAVSVVGAVAAAPGWGAVSVAAGGGAGLAFCASTGRQPIAELNHAAAMAARFGRAKEKAIRLIRSSQGARADTDCPLDAQAADSEQVQTDEIIPGSQKHQTHHDRQSQPKPKVLGPCPQRPTQHSLKSIV